MTTEGSLLPEVLYVGEGDNKSVKTIINDNTNVSGKNGGWYKLRDGSYARYWAWTEGEEKGKIFYVQIYGENVAGNNYTPHDIGDTTETDHGYVVSGYYVNFAPGEPNDDKGHTSQTALAVNYDTYELNQLGKILRSQWDDTEDGIVGTNNKNIYNYMVESKLGHSSLSINAGDTTLSDKIGNITKIA